MAALVRILIPALAGFAVSSQTVESPRSVLVYHTASRSIRPIIGMTGSSYLGEALHADIDYASISPDQQKVFMTVNGNLRIAINSQGAKAVEAAMQDIDRIKWSPDSTTAVLFSSATDRLQWFADDIVSPPVQLLETAQLLAMSATKALIAEGDRLLLISRDQPPVQIAMVDSPAAAAFDPSGESIFVASASRILHYRIAGGSAKQESFLDTSNSLTALAISPDGTLLYTVDSSLKTASSYQTVDGALTASIDLNWSAGALEPLSKNTFLLTANALAGEPLTVLSTGSGLVELFIPAGVTQ